MSSWKKQGTLYGVTVMRHTVRDQFASDPKPASASLGFTIGECHVASTRAEKRELNQELHAMGFVRMPSGEKDAIWAHKDGSQITSHPQNGTSVFICVA